eukprot:3285569-Rhodomonas_salina.2
MSSGKGKGAKRPSKGAPQKSPNKKAKPDQKAQPSILTFFGKGKDATAKDDEEDQHGPNAEKDWEMQTGGSGAGGRERGSRSEHLDGSAARPSVVDDKSEEVEVIDLDASDEDVVVKGSKTAPAVSSTTAGPGVSPVKMMDLKSSTSTSVSSENIRNLLKDTYDPVKSLHYPAPE